MNKYASDALQVEVDYTVWVAQNPRQSSSGQHMTRDQAIDAAQDALRDALDQAKVDWATTA